ncbi:MAG: ParB/RepB/Spo0J family partition protein [Planctomycetaceae bacterium]|nr:ParB/RepB/Spo0J family partition protein [Planctomycetaceae bacterium]
MRRLGRGLNALLGGGDEETSDINDSPAEAAGGVEIGHIHIELIERNPFQPRKDFDEEGLTELAESIKQHGVLQPLLVRPHNGSYQLIAGERRMLASKRAGFETVPCRVLELEDKQVCAVAIEENLKRKDLNVLEKAQAFKEYLDRFNSTIEELAATLSLNRSTVSNFIRLLDLAEPVKQAIRDDKISAGHARALLTLSHEEQVDLCKRATKENLTVRAVEQAVRELQGRATVPFPTPEGEQAPQEQAIGDPNLTNHILSIAQQLRDQLGAKVEIKLRGKDKGRIVIDFDTNDEFERIVRHLRAAA